jgi:GDP-L-fucose synthase
MFWKDKRVLVTGGTGFLGSYLVQKIKERGCQNIFIPQHDKFDLREKQDVIRMYEEAHPDMVIHLAARVGGIGANMKYPGEFFYDNLIMGIQVMEYARRYNVKKFVATGTICVYPKFTKVPFREEDLWKGYPEENNAPYGLAKKMLLVQAQAYRKQYGFNAIYLLPVNLYGPGDNFHPAHSHVIPGIIRKCLEAIENKQDEIILWGTGKPTREFLCVDDCAEAICLATERYNNPKPVNIGSGLEISIKNLAKLIAALSGFKGKIIWDKTKPDGQPRRCLDISQAEREFGFKAKTDFKEGLKKTIDWYRQNYHNLKNNEKGI